LDRDEIMAFLARNKEEMAEKFSVKRIGLFGSHLHGIPGKDSDVDILVELEENTLDHYMDLKFFLEEHIGKPVDLILAESLKPRLKESIVKGAAYA